MLGQRRRKRLVQENNTAELQRQLLFIPPCAGPDRSGEGRDKRGNETQWPMSPSINWPWLFHAVVGLWCWHICRLRKKILMELCQKPRREGGGKRKYKRGKSGEMFWLPTTFSSPLCSHDKQHGHDRVTWCKTQWQESISNVTSQFTSTSGFPRYPWLTPHKS